jgi:hypothetical protein
MHLQKNLRSAALLGAAFTLCTPVFSQSIVYRETFGNATGASAAVSTVGWLADVYTGTLFSAQGGLNANYAITNQAGRVNNADNVANAEVTTSLTNGFIFVGSGGGARNILAYSNATDFTGTLPVGNLSEISFFAGHTSGGVSTLSEVTSRPAIRVGSTWYVPSTFATTASIGGSGFAASAESETFSFSASTQLFALSATDLSIGSTAVALSSLSGNVTQFGVFTPLARTGDFIRIDTYTVSAIPEPSTFTLFAAAGALAAATFCRRRRS